MSLAGVFDVTHQVLNTDLFFQGGLDARRHMDELAVHVAVSVDLLLSKVCLSRQIDAVFFIDADDDEGGLCVIAA